jgi:diguanylate cyclase (GGDEF)-like protein
MRDPASRGEPGGWAAWAGDLWQPRDPAFLELGPGGELLVSRVRVVCAWLGLFGANALNTAPQQRLRPLALAALALAMALVAHALVSWAYRPVVSFLTAVLDVALASLAAEVGRATWSDPLAFLPLALVLALVLAALRHDARVVGAAWVAALLALAWSGAASVAGLLSVTLAGVLLAAMLERARRHHALADADPLTGLRRRDAFEAFLRAELQRSQRHDHRLTLALVEIDRFRELTQRQGGARGTAIQRAAAGVLKRSLRGSDAVARWSSGLFALALPETDASSVRERLETLRQAIAQALRGSAPAASVGVSVAVVAWPSDGDGWAALVAVAEERLRQAREAGGDRLIGPGPAPGSPEEDRVS